jgi:prolyl-tRNA synthetase
MRLSQYFLPTLRDNPKEAEIISHRLMLRAGMIQQTASGIYAWLPMGYKVLRKIEQIVREEQDASGAQEVLMPTLQSADLWKQSGRYDDYGKEMLRIKDRQERDLLYGPTNEEMITDIFRTHIKSYKDVPKNLYHIQWKFRDEIRPRFGVMRGREFLMKDAYSFDLTPEDARVSYQKMFLSYLRTFKRMGLKAIPMRADTGPIGGDLSHEFIILAETGESAVYADKKWNEIDLTAAGLSYEDKAGLQTYFDDMTSIYAATDEKHDPKAIAPENLLSARGIEIGHIFNFGTKYSKPFNAVVQNKEGELVPVEMGSYGIGVSRLVGGIIEACHDEHGIVWPEEVAPFKIGIINLKSGDAACDAACENLYRQFKEQGIEVLYDDRDERAGAKFADMDLIGLPWQVIVGPKGAAAGVAEVKNRKTGEKHEISLESAVSKLAA